MQTQRDVISHKSPPLIPEQRATWEDLASVVESNQLNLIIVDLHVNGLGFRHFLLRKRDGQHTALIIRLHLVALDTVWQAKRPHKLAIRTLNPVESLAIALVLKLALDLQRQRPVPQLDAHGLRIDVGKWRRSGFTPGATLGERADGVP